MTFRLAHISDPHFQSFRDVKVRELLGKRALGGMNLLLRRRKKHSMALLQALAEDLRGRGVDHLALTGDLYNIAIESEWSAALRWLETTQLSPEQVTVIPGNHDAYVAKVVTDGVFERLFAAYQTAQLRVDKTTYPFARLRGDVALVCVSTGVPTGDFGAWGSLGAAQLASLETLLTTPEVKGRRRVLLIHHPPVVHRPGEDRNLRDRTALHAVLARTGADLVLHGHDHRDLFAKLDGPSGTAIPVVGVGSASYNGGAERRSRYNVVEIEGTAMVLVTYAHDQAAGKFAEVRRKSL